MSQPLQHSPIYPGGPCRRCGLSYSVKTAYVPCFEPGDTIETWRVRQGDALREDQMEQHAEEIIQDDRLHVGNPVRHRVTGLVGKVTGFAHDGTTDVMVDDTGPYQQSDFEKLAPQKMSQK
jgi:hypothetical protein